MKERVLRRRLRDGDTNTAPENGNDAPEKGSQVVVAPTVRQLRNHEHGHLHEQHGRHAHHEQHRRRDQHPGQRHLSDHLAVTAGRRGLAGRGGLLAPLDGGAELAGGDGGGDEADDEEDGR